MVTMSWSPRSALRALLQCLCHTHPPVCEELHIVVSVQPAQLFLAHTLTLTHFTLRTISCKTHPTQAHIGHALLQQHSVCSLLLPTGQKKLMTKRTQSFRSYKGGYANQEAVGWAIPCWYFTRSTTGRDWQHSYLLHLTFLLNRNFGGGTPASPWLTVFVLEFQLQKCPASTDWIPQLGQLVTLLMIKTGSKNPWSLEGEHCSA